MEAMGLGTINWESLGTIAAVLFIIANAYYPAKVIAKHYIAESGESVLFFENYMKVHMPLNLLGLLAVLFHGHFADESNITLQVAILVTISLAVIGALMSYHVPKTEGGYLSLLRSQQILFFVWIALIFIGHSML